MLGDDGCCGGQVLQQGCGASGPRLPTKAASVLLSPLSNEHQWWLEEQSSIKHLSAADSSACERENVHVQIIVKNLATGITKNWYVVNVCILNSTELYLGIHVANAD